MDPSYSPQHGYETESSSCDSTHDVPVINKHNDTLQCTSTNTAGVRLNKVRNEQQLVPYTDSDTDEEINETSNTKQKGKKRVRNEKNWKKCIRKQKRVSGKSYLNARGVEVKGKTLKPPCKPTCRLKCYQRFSNEQRQAIFSDFWSEERDWESKRQFVVSCIETKQVARSRKKDESKGDRSHSYKYFIVINNKEEVVCKQFFLNTLAISEMFMRTALKKTTDTGMIKVDLRGKHTPGTKLADSIIDGVKSHIAKYPAYQSHYSRERTCKKYLGNHLNISKMYDLYVEECEEKQVTPGKKWLFRQIFNEDFNLSFVSR